MQEIIESKEDFSTKVTILKALAILLVVSGHLEFSLMGMFTPYSFQLALFFFISGYLFKTKYLDEVQTFIKRRAKSLLLPYFLYNLFYLCVTVLIFKWTGKFWGEPITLKNFFITPFLNGHQFNLACPLWFVTQLFISMVVFLFLFRCLRAIKNNHNFHLIVFSILGFLAIPIAKTFKIDPITLIVIRTIFSLFFIYLGFYYKEYIENKINIFSPKWLGAIITIQSILWMFNRDYDPRHGIGLSYVLVWARFDEQIIVPIFTSLTGIWASLFIVKMLYPYLKNIKFIQTIGENTYHIMANHLLVMYIITAIFLYVNGIPIEERANHNIYWIYNPIQTTYLYFVLTTVISTYIGVFLKFLNKKLFIKD